MRENSKGRRGQIKQSQMKLKQIILYTSSNNCITKVYHNGVHTIRMLTCDLKDNYNKSMCIMFIQFQI